MKPVPKIVLLTAIAAAAVLAAFAGAAGYGEPQAPSAKAPTAGEPSLKITISGPTLVSLGDQLALEISVSNAEGRDAGKGLTVTVTLPDAVEFIEANPPGAAIPSCGQRPATVAWTLAEVGPGAEVRMTVSVRAIKTGSWTPTAALSITAAPFPLRIKGAPGLALSSRDDQDPLRVGRTATQQIEVRNTGTAMCTNIALSVTIAPELEFSGAEAASGEKATVEGGAVRFEGYPILPPGGTLTYKLVWRAVKEGAAKRTAALSYDEAAKPIVEELTITCIK